MPLPLSISSSDEDGLADAEPPERLELIVEPLAGDWSRFGPIEELFARLAAAIEAELGSRAHGQVTIALGDDVRLRELNATFRGVDKATNVLSFPASAFDGSGHLGDVALAAETLLREARDRSIPAEDHLAHLVAHGVLHVLGYDHDSDESAFDMESMETRILARIGCPDPYADDEMDTEVRHDETVQ